MPEVTQSTDDYLFFLFNLPNFTGETILCLLFLIAARLIPIISLSPFLGAKAIPNVAKIFLVICLVAIFLPVNFLGLEKNITFNFEYIIFLFKELLIGFLLGFLAAFPFYIVQSSGSLIDHMRGSSSLQVTDPSTQSQTGPLGILYNYVLILAFYALDGPFLLFNALASSYTVVPVTGWINSAFFSTSIPYWKFFLSLFSQLMQMAIQLAAPSLVGILMAEMFLGIANRLSPNVQIVFLGIPLKSWLGIALLLLAWYLIIQQMGKESINWIKTIEKIFSQMPIPQK
jgi:type III secretion protein T